MPPMAAAVGTSEDVANVAQYVLSLSGSPHDAVKASLGKEKFAACAACHGADGKDNHAVGAPNLTDSSLVVRMGCRCHYQNCERRQDQRHARTSKGS